MNENTQMQDCTRKCWMLSAIAGVVIAILMIAFTGWTFFSSILAGIVIFVVGGFLLKSMLCGALADQAQDTAAPAPAPAPAQAAATPKPAADTAPVADAAAPEAESAEPAAVSAATAPADKVLVKPSARLAGQEELAARKGDWKYEKLAEAALTKAAPAKRLRPRRPPQPKRRQPKQPQTRMPTPPRPQSARPWPPMASPRCWTPPRGRCRRSETDQGCRPQAGSAAERNGHLPLFAGGRMAQERSRMGRPEPCGVQRSGQP